MYFRHFYLLLISLVMLCMLNACQKINEYTLLNYTLTPVLDGASGNSLIIEIDFTGETEGETDVLLGQAWADEQTPWTRFKDISLTSEGKALPFTRKDSRLTIRHEANTPLKLTYHLHQKDGREADGDSGFFYAPVLQNEIYHLIGLSSLAIPSVETRNEIGQRAARVRLNWNLPKNWQSAASFDVSGQTVFPLDKILRTALMAGEFNITSRPIGEKQLNLIMRGKWSFSETQLADKLSRILTALNTSWDDEPVDYQVSLLPLPPLPSGTSFTGTGLNHAFVAVGTPNIELDFLTAFLTHEMTHDWIPNRLGSFPTCDEEEKNKDINCAAAIYWFSEGFTDYFSLSLLKENGLISQSEFTLKTNEILRNYYISPARNVPNTDIQKDFWNDPNVERQPYLRGFLLALNWNQEIIKTSNKQKNMADALRDLKGKAQKNTLLPELTPNYLTTHFSRWVGRDVTSDLTSYITNGETIIPTPENLGGCETLTTRPSFSYNLGFDVDASLGSGIFSGVRENSNAYRAGLRNGMKFLRKVKGGGGDTTRPIVLGVNDAGQDIEVSYLPIDGEGVDVPQYVTSDSKC